ncbi:SCO family protein [Natrialbaceae archaeon A-gly3]
MQRRTFVHTVAAGALAGTAGCLTAALGGEEPGETVLEYPDDQVADSADLDYPAYAEAFPEFALYDPLAETTVDTAEIDGECLVCTAFYDYCDFECIPLINSLVHVQQRAADRGLTDDVRFLAITFDPERDTREELETNAEHRNVDLELGNWHYLRPEDNDEAESIVADDLGIGYEKVGPEEAYDFNHITVTFLVNPGGYVERAYRGESPDLERIADDIETVIDGWE